MTEDELRELLRESRRLRDNPGVKAAYDQLDAAVDAGKISGSQYLEGVREIVNRFKSC